MGLAAANKRDTSWNIFMDWRPTKEPDTSWNMFMDLAPAKERDAS